jgi:hypothetical protein
MVNALLALASQLQKQTKMSYNLKRQKSIKTTKVAGLDTD